MNIVTATAVFHILLSAQKHLFAKIKPWQNKPLSAVRPADSPLSLKVAPKRMGRPVDGGFNPVQRKVYPPCDSPEEFPAFPLSRGAVEHLQVLQSETIWSPPLSHWEGADDLGNILFIHQEGCGMFFRKCVCVECMSHGVGVDA